MRVGNMVLAPSGFTADKHLGAQIYDVTALVREGENVLPIALGDGWYNSKNRLRKMFLVACLGSVET